MQHSSTRRTRRYLSGVLAATLAGLSLVATGVLASPASAVAPSVVVTTNPSPVTPNAENAFTVTITNGDTAVIKSARVSLPATLTSLNSVAVTNAGWTAQTAGNVINVATTSNATQIPNGGTLTVTFKATTPASGTLAIGVQTWANDSQNGTGTNVSGGSVTVGKLDQTITFGALGGKTFGDADFGVSATASSGLTVSFTASGDCSVSGSTVHITGAGHCDITAHQAGNSSYNAAPDVTQGFDIAKANQTISITPIDPQTYAPGATVDVAATATSGLTVSLAVDSGPCTVSGLTITFTGAGVCAFTGTQAGNTNYNAAPAASSSFTINKGAATINVSGDTVTYDGSAHAITATTTPTGLGTLTYTYNGSSTAPTDAGTYTVKVNLVNDDYQATEQTVTLVISPRPLTASFTVQNRTYNGGTDATVIGCTLPQGGTDGVVATDTEVDIDCDDATATFDSKDVGNRTATIGGTYGLTGTRSENYTLAGVNTAPGVISAATLSATITVGDKNYDCTTDVPSYNSTLVGTVYGSDDVDVEVSSIAFDNASVGETHTVTAQLALTGTPADVANYTLAPATATDSPVEISPRPLVGSFSANNKVYDGTTAATVHPNSLTSVVCGEDVHLQVNDPTFANKNVGTWAVTAASMELTGTDKDNYVLAINSDYNDDANITAKPLTSISFTANDKLFDGNSTATPNVVTFNGKVTGDVLTLSGGNTDFWNDVPEKTNQVGTWNVIWSGFTIGGADAGNYSYAGLTTLTSSAKAKILPLYSGKGFYAPVDMGGVWNTIKGGQTVPLKFEMFNAAGTVEQTSMTIFGPDAASQAAAFTVTKVTCPSASASADAIEELVTTGSTQFRYDTTGGQYIQNWKTPTTVNTCYKVSVKALDGTTVGPAYFKITK